jgi:hypothetical protein
MADSIEEEDGEAEIEAAMDAGYAQGVENTEARAIKRINELEAEVKRHEQWEEGMAIAAKRTRIGLEEEVALWKQRAVDNENGSHALELKMEEFAEKYNKLLIYASKYKDHSSACSEWSGHEIQKLCEQCQEWEDLNP